jgi:hypothetical protein
VYSCLRTDGSVFSAYLETIFFLVGGRFCFSARTSITVAIASRFNFV